MYYNEDELILMYAKGNEEALGLLFLIYEKKMRFEAYLLEKKMKDKSFSLQDYIQDIQMNFIFLLGYYDYTKCKLYSFWINIFKKTCYSHFSSKNPIDCISYDENMIENKEIKNNLYFHDIYKLELGDALLNLEFEDLIAYKIITLWSNGYSYQEISNLTTLSIAQVNYYIRKAIIYLKDRLSN